jgi:hypothetical protein
VPVPGPAPGGLLSLGNPNLKFGVSCGAGVVQLATTLQTPLPVRVPSRLIISTRLRLSRPGPDKPRVEAACDGFSGKYVWGHWLKTTKTEAALVRCSLEWLRSCPASEFVSPGVGANKVLARQRQTLLDRRYYCPVGCQGRESDTHSSPPPSSTFQGRFRRLGSAAELESSSPY